MQEALNLSDNLGHVISGIRHELGNPINSIKSALSVLRSNLQRFEQAKQEQYLERTLAEVERVEYLLRSLRSFNALERPTLGAVDLDSFLRGFEPLVIRDLLAQSIELHVVADPGLRALASERALHQVLLNLVSNSADAVASSTRPTIHITARRTRLGPTLRVSDNGVGMSRDMLERLFQPFNTSKPGGTGLGLVITRRLIARMGGTVEVESELGRGTVVSVRLVPA